jgi:hypothetical protein
MATSDDYNSTFQALTAALLMPDDKVNHPLIAGILGKMTPSDRTALAEILQGQQLCTCHHFLVNPNAGAN